MNQDISLHIIEVLAPYEPKEIAVFGSYARNESTSTSDIDVLVSFGKPVTLFDIARILHLFENKYDLKIDLVEKEGLSASFLESIQADLKYIYRDVNRSA